MLLPSLFIEETEFTVTQSVVENLNVSCRQIISTTGTIGPTKTSTEK